MSTLPPADSLGKAVHLFDASFTGLPTAQHGDNCIALCRSCAATVDVPWVDRLQRCTSDCDSCNGRVDLSFSTAAHALATRLIDAGLADRRKLGALAIALTPEIDALLAPVPID